MSGIKTGVDETENRIYYRNYFTSIPDNVQFRLEIKTDQPRISGTIVGRIDSAGSGQYAELDDMGRYKIILPFDLSGRSDGKASAWVRMAQPYAGSSHGMHFPLHKGTEVLLTFIDGDPDRPIIAAAVPNPETPSPVNANNQTMSIIQTGGQNKIAMEDKEGSERILMHSPKQGSYLRIGAPNDPPPADGPTWKGDTMEPDQDQFGMHLYTNGLLDIEAATSNSVILGESTETVVGVDICSTIGLTMYNYLGGYCDVKFPESWDFSPETTEMKGLKTEIKELHTEIGTTKNEIIIECNKALNEEVKAINNSITLTDSAMGVLANQTKVIGDKVDACATKAEVATAKQEAIGEANNATANAIGAVGEQINTIAAKTTLAAESIETLGSHLKTAAEETFSVAIKTHCYAEANHLAGLYNIL
jgi:type VI secretion system secreted protein VgrG